MVRNNYTTENKIKNVIKGMLECPTIPVTKFKFWHKEKKEIFDVSRIDFDLCDDIEYIHILGDEKFKPEDGTLLQSTGLFDERNDEIYVGDIVVCHFFDEQFKSRVVFWDNGWRVIGCTTEEFKDNCNNFVSKIGNMFDDDDLMKVYMEKINDKI